MSHEYVLAGKDQVYRSLQLPRTSEIAHFSEQEVISRLSSIGEQINLHPRRQNGLVYEPSGYFTLKENDPTYSHSRAKRFIFGIHLINLEQNCAQVVCTTYEKTGSQLSFTACLDLNDVLDMLAYVAETGMNPIKIIETE